MTALTSLEGERSLPRWFASAFRMLSGMQYGAIDVCLPDGRVFRAKGPEDGPHAQISVNDVSIFSRVVRDGDVGFAEAYMEGGWDTPDLQALLDILLMNNEGVAQSAVGVAMVRTYERFRHWLRSNSKVQARKNISHHYDLGNDFYSTWLDQTMTYSSALFKPGADELEAAQTLKYASMCDRIGVKGGDHLLEIGCGWGGFAEYAAKERGARVTGLTISREQHDFARERMFREGLNDRVDIVLRDYRDEKGTFDGVASIEMFEAVGEKYWPVYFDTVRDRLKPGGTATLQVITVPNSIFETYRNYVDFIQKYIFPGGMLPSPDKLHEHIQRAGLTFTGSIEFGKSYSETLRRWHERFNERWDDIAALGFDERFRRMWSYYLTSCASCFEWGTTDVTQVSMQRPA